MLEAATMVSWKNLKRHGPIGVDLGCSSIKLVQLNADRTEVLDAARWDLPRGEYKDADQRRQQLIEALRQAREGHRFRGRDAVLCLGSPELFVQNIRVAKGAAEGLERSVRTEAESRLPFPPDEAELRYLEAADVRHGEAVKRELILLACQRSTVEETVSIAQAAGLRPVAIDVEPAALLRCYHKQFRRDEDRVQGVMYIHIGATSTIVVIAQGNVPLFVKYVSIAGQQLDEAVSRHLKMELPQAVALRRNCGDRRSDQQDPEIVRSLAESVRPVLERWVNELSLCLRYYSVTFRGQPLARGIVSGGEATPALCEMVGNRLGLRCELGEPLRAFDQPPSTGRKTQWDLATGLALREVAP
jgi:type IV pilus assembly protein PilM